MKFIQLKNLNWVLSALVVFGFASCKKMNSTGFTPGTGTPVITSVRTLSQSVVDSSRTNSVTTYDNTGVPTTVISSNYSPVISAFDSTTTTGKLSSYYVLKGSNLGSTTKIAINGVSIYFNRAFNSDSNVIFQIPTNVPYVQPQANTIVVTTLYGSVTYKFTTLPPPPTITGLTDVDFIANSQITLVGKGFASVSAVSLRATKDPITIVSQNDSTLVMKMPASATSTESTLLFTYTSGTNTGAQTASTVLFYDLDNSYQIFVNSNLQNGWFNNSWTNPAGLTTGVSHSGTASFALNFPAGGWQVEGMADWNTPGKFAYDPSYKYLTFWIKGGAADHKLVLVGDQMVGGYGQVQNANGYAGQIVDVPPTVWTFVKIPLCAPSTPFSKTSTLLNFWANGTPAQQLGFFLQGQPGDVNEVIYFDEMAFIK